MGLWYLKDSGFELTTFSDADHAEAEYVALSASCAQVLLDENSSYRERVENGIVELYFVRTEYQSADMFMKALSKERFEYLVVRIGMRCLTPAELEILANKSA
ncbi:hypothetical protein Tco_0564044 [Tanacetum coccineum]